MWSWHLVFINTHLHITPCCKFTINSSILNLSNLPFHVDDSANYHVYISLMLCESSYEVYNETVSTRSGMHGRILKSEGPGSYYYKT